MPSILLILLNIHHHFAVVKHDGRPLILVRKIDIHPQTPMIRQGTEVLLSQLVLGQVDLGLEFVTDIVLIQLGERCGIQTHQLLMRSWSSTHKLAHLSLHLINDILLPALLHDHVLQPLDHTYSTILIHIFISKYLITIIYGALYLHIDEQLPTLVLRDLIINHHTLLMRLNIRSLDLVHRRSHHALTLKLILHLILYHILQGLAMRTELDVLLDLC